jgi:hypothetical protein
MSDPKVLLIGIDVGLTCTGEWGLCFRFERAKKLLSLDFLAVHPDLLYSTYSA